MDPLPYLFRRPLLLLVLAYVLALAALRPWQESPRFSDDDPAWFADGRAAALRGAVLGDPDFVGGRFRFVLKARQIKREGDGFYLPVRGRVVVRLEGPDFSAGWGDEVELWGRFSRPPSAPVPGAFDYRRFLAERDIHSQLYVAAGKGQVLRPAPPWSPLRWMSALRRRFLEAFDRHLSGPAAELLAGLVLGKKPSGVPDMELDFRRSGTYHLLVASGSNVGFVMGLWILAGRWVLCLARRPLWALSIPWAFLYVGVAGADPPVVRAAVMASLGVFAYLLGREDRLEHVAGLSAGLLLLWRPRALFEAGFQMSYAAVLGIVMAAPALEEAAAAMARRFLPDRVRRGFWGRASLQVLRLFLVSLCAQLALSPLLIHYFHRFSWAGLWANMLAVPGAALCLALGTGLFALDLVSSASSATAAAAFATENAARGLWAVVRWFSRFPSAEVALSWGPAQTWTLGALAAAALVVLAGRGRWWKFGAGMWAAGLPLLFLLAGPRADGRLRLTWLDEDAAVALSPRGRVTLVNGGGEEAARYRVAPYLRRLSVSRIDRLIVTRGEPPPGGGLRFLLREFETGEFLCPPSFWEDPGGAALRALAEAGGTLCRSFKEGEAWEEDGVLWTAPGAPGPDGSGPGLWVRHGRQSALLAAAWGPAPAERVPGAVAVLEWPSRGGAPPDGGVLERLRPRWILFAGDRPPPDVRSFAAGPRVWVTGREGAFQWVSWGEESRPRVLRAPPPPLFRVPPPAPSPA